MDNIEKAVSGVDFDGIEAGDFGAFRQLMHVLRSDVGCPWDREQTLDSLKVTITDELAEVLAGIDLYHATGDAGNFCEELGDLLMNFVMLTDLASSQGLFSMEDVIREAGRKMLRRHPHVFGEEARRGFNPGVLDESEAMPRSWKDIKAVEKRGRTPQQAGREKQAIRAAKAQMVEMLKNQE